MSTSEILLSFPQPQHRAVFLQRTQRFLASMELADGSQELVYCANSGAGVGNLSSGMQALLWESKDLKRKRRFTWRAVEVDGHWVGTDTHLSNRIVEESIRLRLIPGLEAYDTIAREHLVAPGVRVDFLLSGPDGECLVEVKTSNIVHEGVARYPDSPNPRGIKQIEALTRRCAAGQRSLLLFLVQRSDALAFQVNTSNSAAYSDAINAATSAGMEMMAVSVSVQPDGFGMPHVLPCRAT
jgi:sugar fermentation stimulation protein A